MLKRIAVLSDIHGNILALEAVVADMKKRQVDGVLNLGDHISGPLWPYETAQYLMEQDWIRVAGNHDRELINQDPRHLCASDRHAYQFIRDRERDWLRGMPAITTLQDEFTLFHGTPSSDTAYLLETIDHGRTRLATPAEIGPRMEGATTRILLCGHTHVQRVVQVPENRLIINPGSVGLPAYDDDTPVYHVSETGSPHARYAILEVQNGDWEVEFISISYDYHKAAEQARKNNRLEWEFALLTGYMPDRNAG